MMRARSIPIMLLFAALIAPVVTGQSNEPQGPASRYIVQIAPSADAPRVAEGVARNVRGRLGHVYTRAVHGFSIELPSGLSARSLLSRPGVLRVEPDVRVYAVAQTIPTGINRIDVDRHATMKIDGTDDALNVDIAVIDTGIDTDHPDLRVVGGTRFYTRAGRARQDNRYDDDNGHGTHCAGIAAAIDNQIGVVGVAPGARLWAVKVLDFRGSGYLSDLIAGIDWVTARAGTIEVANMSLAATGKSDILRTAIQNSVAAGVLCVAAAGNSARDIFGPDAQFNTNDDTIPAAYPEVATISALADSDGKPGGDGPTVGGRLDDSFANFSNYSAAAAAGNPVGSPGAGIDLMMPGVNIRSCWRGGGYRSASGTSMAAPHATGLAALYVAEHGRAFTASGVYAIRQALIDAGMDQASGLRLATSASEPDNRPENLGWAGQPVTTDTEPTVTIAHPADGSIVAGTVTIQVSADDSEDETGSLTVQASIDGAEPQTAAYNSTSGYYELAWNTTTVADGQHVVDASATDSAGNTADAARIQLVVENTDLAPTAAIVNPPFGDTVSGIATIQVEADDDEDAAGTLTVVVILDGGTPQAAPFNPFTGYYELAWDTTAAADADHTIDARATDSGGKAADAPQVVVTVSNEVAAGTMHVASVEIQIIPYWSSLQRIRAQVVIVDSAGNAVEAAAVTGTFSGDVAGHRTAVTDAAGLAVLEVMWWRSRQPSVTFCVDHVSHGTLTYEPADNDQTCDTTD